jgi:hypothetical protein
MRLSIPRARTVPAEQLGAYLLVGVGTFGMNQVLRQLILLGQSGLDAYVGSVLIIENDSANRLRFAEDVPPVFRDRVRYGYSESFNGGGGNRVYAWVMDRVGTWGQPIRRATAEIIDLHLRRSAHRAPAVVLAWISLGGHAPMGLLVIEDLRRRFDGSLIICATALPRHVLLRETFADLKPRYDSCGADGWILADNLGQDPTTADYGQVGLITALADAALHSDQSTQANNVFTLALGRRGRHPDLPGRGGDRRGLPMAAGVVPAAACVRRLPPTGGRGDPACPPPHCRVPRRLVGRTADRGRGHLDLRWCADGPLP